MGVRTRERRQAARHTVSSNLEAYLLEYLDGAGLANDPKAVLFQTYSRATGQLTGNPLPQANAYAMIQRPVPPGITTRLGNHTVWATVTSRTAARSKEPRRWPIMPRHA